MEWNFKKELKMLATIYLAGILPWAIYDAFGSYEGFMKMNIFSLWVEIRWRNDVLLLFN